MKNKKGFTLIELIVVIAIIAVLAAVLIPSLLGFVHRARVSQANSNAKNVHTSASAWLTDFSTEGNTVVSSAIVVCSAQNSLSGTMSASNDVDLSKAWSASSFKGWWGFQINSSGTGVSVAVYSSKTAIVAADVKKYTSDEQDAMGQSIVGCYPKD